MKYMNNHSSLAILTLVISLSILLILLIDISSLYYMYLNGTNDTFMVFIGLLTFLGLIGLVPAIVLNIVVFIKKKESLVISVIGFISLSPIIIILSILVYKEMETKKISQASIVEYGIYHSTISDSTVTDDISKSKSNFVKDVYLIEQTDTIIAKIGNSFGIRYLINGSPDGASIPLKIYNLFPMPGIVDKKANTVKYFTFRNVNRTIGDTSYTGFTFEHDYELLPGNRKYQILFDDSIIVEKTFTIISE